MSVVVVSVQRDSTEKGYGDSIQSREKEKERETTIEEWSVDTGRDRGRDTEGLQGEIVVEIRRGYTEG